MDKTYLIVISSRTSGDAWRTRIHVLLTLPPGNPEAAIMAHCSASVFPDLDLQAPGRTPFVDWRVDYVEMIPVPEP